MREHMGEVAIKPEHIPIYRLEQAIRTLPPVEMPVDNDFCHGVYARTVHIPAGTILTGAIHKDECFFVVRSGTILITTDTDPVKVSGGYMSITKPGTKRVGLALEDTVVTTFHANPEEIREQDKLWDHFTEPAPDNLLEVLGKMELEAQ